MKPSAIMKQMVDYYPKTQQIGLNSFEVEAVTSYCANGPGRGKPDFKGLFFDKRNAYLGIGRSERGVERTGLQHEHEGDRLELPATLEWVKFVEKAFVHWRDKYPATDMETIGEEHQMSPLYKKAQLDVELIDGSLRQLVEIAEDLSRTD